MKSQIGYLKLLINQSILTGPLDFEIKRVACIYPLISKSMLGEMIDRQLHFNSFTCIRHYISGQKLRKYWVKSKFLNVLAIKLRVCNNNIQSQVFGV